VNPPEQTSLVLAGQFVLPNSKNCPTALTERAIHKSVTSFVTSKFISPESTIGCGLRCVLGTAVPETAVHKHRELEFLENEIRFAEDFLIPSPAGDSVPTK
jgi:hypothetical protein